MTPKEYFYQLRARGVATDEAIRISGYNPLGAPQGQAAPVPGAGINARYFTIVPTATGGGRMHPVVTPPVGASAGHVATAPTPLPNMGVTPSYNQGGQPYTYTPAPAPQAQRTAQLRKAARAAASNGDTASAARYVLGTIIGNPSVAPIITAGVNSGNSLSPNGGSPYGPGGALYGTQPSSAPNPPAPPAPNPNVQGTITLGPPVSASNYYVPMSDPNNGFAQLVNQILQNWATGQRPTGQAYAQHSQSTQSPQEAALRAAYNIAYNPNNRGQNTQGNLDLLMAIAQEQAAAGNYTGNPV